MIKIGSTTCLDHFRDLPGEFSGKIHFSNGTKKWLRNGKLHREDGPAIIKANGKKVWYRYGHIFRDDGPAVIKPDGTRYWYKNGRFTQETS